VERARQEFLISHYLLRQTLCRYLRTDARSIGYRYGQHGKPHLKTPGRHELNFSLSHSGDRLLIAICDDCEIGVDIEQIQERSNPLQLARHFMSEDEALQLSELNDPVAQRVFFFTLWTRKEAYVKALGKGFFHAINKTDMHEISAGIHVPSSEDHRAYRVIDLEIAGDYKAAVAIRMDGDSPANAIATRVLEQ
jgi:4'-phosphopantetheinyl transferase